jgi:hypothetical protein
MLNMGLEYKYWKMEIPMKGSLNLIKNMEKGNITIKMGLSKCMKGIGLMI